MLDIAQKTNENAGKYNVRIIFGFILQKEQKDAPWPDRTTQMIEPGNFVAIQRVRSGGVARHVEDEKDQQTEEQSQSQNLTQEKGDKSGTSSERDEDGERISREKSLKRDRKTLRQERSQERTTHFESDVSYARLDSEGRPTKKKKKCFH